MVDGQQRNSEKQVCSELEAGGTCVRILESSVFYIAVGTSCQTEALPLVYCTYRHNIFLQIRIGQHDKIERLRNSDFVCRLSSLCPHVRLV